MVSCFNVPSIHPGSHVHVGVNTGTRFSYKFMCIDNVFIRHLILGVYVLGLRVRTCAILELYRYFPQKIFADLQPLFVIFLFIGASNSCCHRKTPHYGSGRQTNRSWNSRCGLWSLRWWFGSQSPRISTGNNGESQWKHWRQRHLSWSRSE